MHWTILPAYLVRTAGFAFARLESLRCSQAVAAADALDLAAAIRRAAGEAFDAQLSQERYADNPMFDDPAVRKAVSRHVKQARAFARGLADTAAPAEALREVVRVVPHVADLAGALVRAHAAWQAAAQRFAATFAADFERARGALRAMYRDEQLQEAVFLESPEAFERIRQLLESEGARNARARQRERLAAMYAQRFCAKNDTNSICGPHGVAYVPAVAVAAVPEIAIGGVVRRATYFSHWAAQAVLDAAVARAGEVVRTYQLQPGARIEAGAIAWCVMDHDATTSFRRRYARSKLPAAADRLVAALAQPHTRAELVGLAGELVAEDVIDFVAELVAAGVVLMGPRLPPGLFDPLRTVAAIVERWPAGDARTWALDEVAGLAALTAAFARAPFADRPPLAGTLAARYVAATGTSATRGEGQHYADRSLLHEDACVDVRCELGTVRAALDDVLPALVAAVALPLELARERAREWFAARFGPAVRVPALEAHRAFDEDRVLDTPAATPRAIALRAAIEDVRAAIGVAVGRASDGIARLGTADLRAAVPETTAQCGYVSADLMLRRAGGATEIVLGEVHGFFWLPTCLLDVLPDEHRARVVEQMRSAVRAMAGERPTAECVFLHTQATDRRFPLATTDLQLMVPGDRPGAIDLGRLDVRLAGDHFEFLHGDAEVVPLVAYNTYPFMLYTSRIAPLFDDFAERFFPDSLLPATVRDGDGPRLVLDGIVVRRRSWRRPVARLRAALAGDEAALLRGAQALRRELGCGRCVFVSLAGEPKPVLVDFDNVFLLEALANLCERQAVDAMVKLGEMLPAPDELVAIGPDGARTSELRMGFYRAPGAT